MLISLGERIRAARLRCQLTTTVAARRAGISRTTLYRVEAGDSAVTMGSYLRVLATLGLARDIHELAANTTTHVGGRRTEPPATSDSVEKPARAVMARPHTLREAALQGRSGHADALLREFLDQFYVTPDSATRASMLAEEPPSLGNACADAYFAAVAEHLALRDRLPVPVWTSAPGRFLHRPFFPGGLESLKATMLKESPVAFRRRLIFVDADPLYRPRRDTAGAEIGA